MFPLYDNNPTIRFPYITIALIVINFATLIWWVQLPEQEQERVVIEHGFIPARVAQLNNPNLVVKVRLEPANVPQIQPVAQPPVRRLKADTSEILASLFSAMFLHGGWLHLLGNMWFLWLFGNNVEDRLGHITFLFFYLLGGLLATACHWAVDPNSTIPVIGASGAVAAVLGAYGVTFPLARVKTLIFLIVIITVIELPALVVLGFWFLGQLLEAVGAWNLGVNGGVAWWAHIGGFVAGLFLMPLLATGAPPPGSKWHEEAKEAFA